jgi:hypothetical protein
MKKYGEKGFLEVFTYTFAGSPPLKKDVVHIGRGFLMLKSHHEAITNALMAAWPGNTGKQPQGKTAAAETKRRPFELLREAVWPLGTSLKVVGLLSSASGTRRKRAPFHQERINVTMYYLEKRWNELRKTFEVARDRKLPFPKEKTKAFLDSHVRII